MCFFCDGRSNYFEDSILVYNLFNKDFLLVRQLHHTFTNIREKQQEQVIKLKFTYCPLCGKPLDINVQKSILDNHRDQLIPQLDPNIKTCFFSQKNKDYVMDIFFEKTLDFNNINDKLSLSIHFDPRTGELLHA